MKRIALISAILENPQENQSLFNQIVSEHRDLVKGRMGLPFDEADIAVIALTVVGPMDEINRFTGQLGKVPSTMVKVVTSKKELA